MSSGISLFCVEVHGPGVWFTYLGGGVLGGVIWGMGVRFEVGVGIARDWSAVLAMLGVSPVMRVRRAATST